jgi:hypothetical protein
MVKLSRKSFQKKRKQKLRLRKVELKEVNLQPKMPKKVVRMMNPLLKNKSALKKKDMKEKREKSNSKTNGTSLTKKQNISGTTRIFLRNLALKCKIFKL